LTKIDEELNTVMKNHHRSDVGDILLGYVGIIFINPRFNIVANPNEC